MHGPTFAPMKERWQDVCWGRLLWALRWWRDRWAVAGRWQKGGAVCVLILLALRCWPLPSVLFSEPSSVVIAGRNGGLLGASIASDGQWRFPADGEVPIKFVRCITAFEDRRFFFHPGIDPLSIARAFWQNARWRKRVSGGSTLTMQLARLRLGHRPRTVGNKLLETVDAIRLELRFSKRWLLREYAANAPFGSNVVGLWAAAWRYYGRPPALLSWGETAALAVLPNAPSLVRPGKNSDALRRKRDRLLDRLALSGAIDPTTCALAKTEPLPLAPLPLPQKAPHLLERLKKETGNGGGTASVIGTTLDEGVQAAVANIVERHHAQLKGNQINNIAAMVVEVATGNTLAYVGNTADRSQVDFEADVDVLAARRSPGSTLKPLLYAALLTDGGLLPRQLIADLPMQIGNLRPENFDLGFDGAVAADRALSRSLNVPAVRMLQLYKYQRFYGLLKRCGITTLENAADHYGLGLILGGCEISPFELAGIYASMARAYTVGPVGEDWPAGVWSMPRLVTNGPAPSAQGGKRPPLFGHVALWHTFNAMNEVMRPGEEGLWQLFSASQRIAWKTGTSFGFRDAWAVGITPKYCVLVWAGNTTGIGRPGLLGVNTAGPVLFEIFRSLPTSPWFRPPGAVTARQLACRQSGFKAGIDCQDVDTVLTEAQALTVPALCPYCRKVMLDPTGSFRVNSSCELPANMRPKSWFVLPPAIEAYYRSGHPAYKPLPPLKSNCAPEATKQLDIIYPDDNAVVMVPKEAGGKKGRVVAKAAHRATNGKLFWHLDNDYIGTTERFHQMELLPLVGKHLLTIVDEEGNSVSKKFEVKE